MWPGYSGLTDLQKQTQEKVALSHGWAWPEDKMKKTSEKLNQNPKMKENSPLETLHLFSFPSKMIGLLVMVQSYYLHHFQFHLVYSAHGFCRATMAKPHPLFGTWCLHM